METETFCLLPTSKPASQGGTLSGKKILFMSQKITNSIQDNEMTSTITEASDSLGLHLLDKLESFLITLNMTSSGSGFIF